MKKPYTRPTIEAESFQLDADVAVGCHDEGFIAIHFYETQVGCGYGVYFSAVQCQIDVTPDKDDGGESMCYHGPTLTFGKSFTNS